MIKRYIPEKYDIPDDLLAVIKAFLDVEGITTGPKGYGMKGRLVWIDATLDAAQAQALKAAVVPLFLEVQDFTA